ncbi:MAG TPA: Obg family GTPase CgtA, partial [Candidatus Baltobacteraceae bacterium]|nr:Obg family GTPase CgtA [Candidatus Baltobacteraceae bacterium]
ERTRALVHLLDGAKTLEEIVNDKETIERELSAWNPKLIEKPTLLVVSKMDLPDAQERLHELQARFPTARGISSATSEGVRDLVYALWQTIQNAPLPEIVTPPPALIELVAPDAFAIERGSDGAFVITGERVERLAALTNFDSEEGLARFERVLAKIGVEKKLRALGAAEGDTVRIGQYEFTYS